MGARSSPEGYRVAVARYGLPVRILGLLLLVMVAAACSHVTGTKSSKSGRPPACDLIAKLDDIANRVAQADVHDPDAFEKTLTTAVADYVTNVRELKVVGPITLHEGLNRVEADVQQLRFDAALTDRGELDAYAARTCGRVAGTGTTVVGATTGSTGTTTASTIAGTPTTVATGPTTTTLPSDG
jgi:hypothetical protein